MANKSLTELRKDIAEVEARLDRQRREIRAALRATPRLVKSTLSWRRRMTVAFLAAAIGGGVLALRRRARVRAGTA